MVCYLQVENLTKSYGELVMFDNISFAINEGERIALIARNGGRVFRSAFFAVS
jgi:ATP-binding cassette subfamily F protein uup